MNHGQEPLWSNRTSGGKLNKGSCRLFERGHFNLFVQANYIF